MKKKQQQDSADYSADSVKILYEKYPYPSRTLSLVQLKEYSEFIFRRGCPRFSDFLILDAGCGTGELSNSLSFSNSVIGIDISSSSLSIARETAKKYNLSTQFFEKDMLTFSYPKKFQAIIALGSVHHTENPKKAFENLSSLLTTDGILVFGFYNKYTRIRLRLKQFLLYLLAGKNTEKRISLAQKLFPEKKNTAYYADKYAHPREHYFSVNQIAKWFKNENLEILSIYPFVQPSPFSFLTQLKLLLQKKNSFFIFIGRKK